MDPSAVLDAASSRYHAITKATKAGDSEIQEFYRDAVIFITGGSGFIGKQLVEKLFRRFCVPCSFWPTQRGYQQIGQTAASSVNLGVYVSVAVSTREGLLDNEYCVVHGAHLRVNEKTTDDDKNRRHARDVFRGLHLSPTGERNLQACFSERVQYGGGSVHVWAGISSEGRTELVFIENGTLTGSCQIKRIYLLMRSRKDQDIQQRLVSMLQDPVFDPLRESQPGFADRITPVAGDIAQLQLGLASDDWKTIAEEVSIIFHVAATIRFDEPLQSAVLLNVRGTREVLRLARACTKLRSLVHVSTAFAFATADRIGDEVGDQLHKPPVPPEMLIQMAENIDKERIDVISSSLISGWPNTYCFTKAAAEDLVRSFGEHLPVCVVRPSIVIEAYTEPLPGWLEENCVFGASGLILGSTLGVIHTIRARRDIYVDFVPVDYVNNVVIAAGWETGKGGGSQTKVYAVTSTRKGIQWSDVSTCLNKKGRNYISPKASWYGFVWETNNYYLHLFYTIILHFIPAYLIDGVTSVFGKKSGLVDIYKKIYKMSIVLRYFTNNDWKFNDDNTVELRKNMSETDKIIFNFDITDIDVSEWLILWVLGLRKYVVKDGLKGTKYAVKQQKIYYFINCLAVFVISFSLLLFFKVLYF